MCFEVDFYMHQAGTPKAELCIPNKLDVLSEAQESSILEKVLKAYKPLQAAADWRDFFPFSLQLSVLSIFFYEEHVLLFITSR